MDITDEVDLFVVGGGVNGCGIARDASGRGLRVLLCEKDDLASHTSSYSTKLIHGGLRYLENYELKMVREALTEREVLMEMAPHMIWPLSFVLPHAKHLRPAWMIRTGLFLYDHLGKRKRLPGSGRINMETHVAGAPLKSDNKVAFTYADCATMDSRLTVLSALDASEKGATILTRTECVRVRREGDGWLAELQTEQGTRLVKARAMVNAAGPWVADFISGPMGAVARYKVRLVQGSHIIVPKLFDHEYAYIFQNSDNRIVFAIPYENDFTLIGTTDLEYIGDPAEVRATDDEVAYLCTLTNDYFKQTISPSDVVSTFSGVRPLFDDESRNASKVTREYVLSLNQGNDGRGAPVLNIFGGKLTAFRLLSQKSVNLLMDALAQSGESWTETSVLPGGDIPDHDFEVYLDGLKQKYSWMDEQLLKRYARQFGSRIGDVIKDAKSQVGLGEYFGAGLYANEVRYLMEKEWAKYPEDILWRRTRQGLWADDETVDALARFMSVSV